MDGLADSLRKGTDMNKELISTMYFLAWMLASTVWGAAFQTTGNKYAAVVALVWLVLAIIVWWFDLRPIQRKKLMDMTEADFVDAHGG